MKFDILHRTRYVYASPVRDSFNDVRLEPPSIPEQTVQSFLLRVLPAVRLKHYTDFYSNWIHHFEIPEAHSYLLIESRSQVVTHWPAAIALDAAEGQADVWHAALAIMRFTHGYLKYQSNSTHVHTHMRDVIKERRGV